MFIVIAMVLSVSIGIAFDLTVAQGFLVAAVIGGIGGWMQAECG